MVFRELVLSVKSASSLNQKLPSYIRAERSVCRLGESEFVSFMDSACNSSLYKYVR